MANQQALKKETTQGQRNKQTSNGSGGAQSPKRSSAMTKARKKTNPADNPPEFGKEEHVWKLIGNKRPQWFYLKAETPATILDENGKKISQNIRYCEGITTIIASEQGEDPRKSPIIMRNGMIRIPAENPTLQEYVWNLRYRANPPMSDIEMEDKEAEAAIENERYDVLISNDQVIMGMNTTQCRGLIRAIGKIAEPNAPLNALRAKLRKANGENPFRLQELMQDDSHEVRHFAAEAVEKGLVNQDGNNIAFADGTVIGTKSISLTPVDYLANKCLEDRDFRRDFIDFVKDNLDQEED